MRAFLISMISLLSLQASEGKEKFYICAQASLESITIVISRVREFDDSPILSVTQGRVPSAPGKLTKPNVPDDGDLDENSFIVTTGYVKGPRNGIGQTHTFKLVLGKWVLVKTQQWVS